MDNVTVPVELPDDLKDVLGCQDYGIIAWRLLKENYSIIVAHFQANPTVSDDVKAANYWRAIACREIPKFLPARINIKSTCMAGLISFGPGAFDCERDPTFGPYIKIEGKHHELHHLPLGAYTVTKWRENEEGENAEK